MSIRYHIPTSSAHSSDSDSSSATDDSTSVELNAEVYAFTSKKR